MQRDTTGEIVPEQYERIANADVPFSSNAQAALDRLDEYYEHHEEENAVTEDED